MNSFSPVRSVAAPKFYLRHFGRTVATYNTLKDAEEALCWQARKLGYQEKDMGIFVQRTMVNDKLFLERVG